MSWDEQSSVEEVKKCAILEKEKHVHPGRKSEGEQAWSAEVECEREKPAPGGAFSGASASPGLHRTSCGS